MNKLTTISLAVGAFLLFPSIVSAQTPEFTEAFVCPVIESEALINNPQAKELGDTGAYTIGPSTTANHLYIPEHATNGDGTHSPGDVDQSAPRDTDYTAIWAK